MNYNELSKAVHKNAIEKGFWNEPKSDEHCLALVITEVAEAIEADRHATRANLYDFKASFEDSWCDFSFKGYQAYIKGSIEEEFADIAIRLLDLAGARGVYLNFMETPQDWFNKSFSEMAYAFIRNMTSAQFKYTIACCINEALSFIVAWAKHLDIDLEYHMKMKAYYNKLREPMHGKKY